MTEEKTSSCTPDSDGVQVEQEDPPSPVLTKLTHVLNAFIYSAMHDWLHWMSRQRDDDE